MTLASTPIADRRGSSRSFPDSLGATPSEAGTAGSIVDRRPSDGARRHDLTIALTAAVLVALAIFSRFAVSPWVERLPVDYSSLIVMPATQGFRETLDMPMGSTTSTGRRVDRVLTVMGDIATIQSGVEWTDSNGQLLYRTDGIYAVDRTSRRNVSGYGNISRAGQFLIPPGFDGASFQLWDANYAGPRDVAFVRDDEIDGLPVRVYRFTVSGLDETAAYDFLPDVPERFKARSDGAGLLWVEPVSGVMIDFTDDGRSYLVDPANGQELGEITFWNDVFNAETKATQRALAVAWRAKILAARIWVPTVLLVLAVAWLAGAMLWRRRKPGTRLDAASA